jgi:RNA polymerase sigma factor (sigma-70 family)
MTLDREGGHPERPEGNDGLDSDRRYYPNCEALYLEHRDALWRSAQRVLPRDRVAAGTSAEDVVQQVMLEVMQRGIPSSIQNVRAYLITLVTYRAIDALRKANKTRSGGAEAPAPPFTEDLVANVAQQNILLEQSAAHFGDLTTNQLYAIKQRVMEGRPAKAVAEELHVAPPRIAQLVEAALKTLRKGLGEDHDGA